jgi:hypothetical protein
MEGFWLINSGCSRHMTRDRRWFSSLTPVMTKEYINFGDNGKGRVLSVGTVKVSKSVTLQRVSLVKLWTVYFATPNMFITLWSGFDYGTTRH